MKRLLIYSIITFASLGLVSPVLAQSRTAIDSELSREVNKISPFDLVTGSYQGRFVNEGIPSGGRFTAAVHANKIHAEDLVQSAIAKGRLTENSLEDRSYISSVEFFLDNLDKN